MNGGGALPGRPPVISTRRPWQTMASSRSMAQLGAARARNQAGPQYDADLHVEVIAFPTLTFFGNAAFLSFELEDDAYFDMQSITALSGGPPNTNQFFSFVGTTVQLNVQPNFVSGCATLQIADGGTGRNLFSTPVALNTIAGIGAQPHVLPLAHRFVPRSKVNVFIANADNGNNSLFGGSLCLIGTKTFLPDVDAPFNPNINSWAAGNGRTYAEDYFGYSFAVGELAAGATVVVEQPTEADSDFQWMMGSMCASIQGTGGGTTQGQNQLLTVQVTDVGLKTDLFDQPVAAGCVFGEAEAPAVYANPHIFLARSRIRLTITNSAAGAIDNIFFTMEGRKIFTVETN